MDAPLRGATHEVPQKGRAEGAHVGSLQDVFL